MPAINSQLFKDGKCVICGQITEHKNPAMMSRENIFRHRRTERRDCALYEDCLTQGAIDNTVCVPCIVCDAFFPFSAMFDEEGARCPQ
jgi:rRNA maturation protein Nop10